MWSVLVLASCIRLIKVFTVRTVRTHMLTTLSWLTVSITCNSKSSWMSTNLSMTSITWSLPIHVPHFLAVSVSSILSMSRFTEKTKATVLFENTTSTRWNSIYRWSTAMPPPGVTLIFDLWLVDIISMSQAQVYIWPNFGENIYKDIVFTWFFGSLPANPNTVCLKKHPRHF